MIYLYVDNFWLLKISNLNLSLFVELRRFDAIKLMILIKSLIKPHISQTLGKILCKKCTNRSQKWVIYVFGKWHNTTASKEKK